MEGPLCILSKNIHILKPGLYRFYNNSNSKTSLDNVFDCSGSVFRLLLYQQPIGGIRCAQPTERWWEPNPGEYTGLSGGGKMCALLRLVREIKVMYAEKMKMGILRREKNISTPPTRKSVDSCCQPGEKLIRLVLAGLWQLVSNLTDRRSSRAASHHSVFFWPVKRSCQISHDWHTMLWICWLYKRV